MTLHEFIEWFRNDLAFKAPEQWPGQMAWFLETVKERYPDVEETDED